MSYKKFSSDLNQVMPLTPVVKQLIILNTVIWVLGIVIVERFLPQPFITQYLGLVPYDCIRRFFIWQLFTYNFIHSSSPFHLVFNMLLLWWLGGELERYWGKKRFLVYYMTCGFGSAFLYCLVLGIYGVVTGNIEPLLVPVVGASAAIFGLMVGFGKIFGERIVFFMMIFPMKAKAFVAILAAIEVVMVLNNGVGGGDVANLAHVGGLVTGFFVLFIWPRIKRLFRGGGGGPDSSGQGGKPKSSHLRLVVNNDEINDLDNPRIWN